MTEKLVADFAHTLLTMKSCGGRVYLVGNGGSASSASHFAADLGKLGFDAICLTDNASRLTAIINDSGWDNAYTEMMPHFRSGDALVIFTVHGCEATKTTGGSTNLFEAAKRCRDCHGTLFVFSGNNGGQLKKLMGGHYLTVESSDCDVVEGLHVVQAHQVCAALKEMMK